MNTFPDFTPATLRVGARDYRIVDLPALGADYPRLPVVLRLLLENVVRHQRGAERAATVAALFDWLRDGASEAEIAFQPGRVLMHDTTSTPALVDIAAMRDALAEAGADPALLNPTLPVDVSVDHSLAVEVHARPDAARVNIGHEIRRNGERYRFLRWAAGALRGVRIHPPGTGIMHTLNLEQLAVLVRELDLGGERWAAPDMMIGTDSHTPMINGIGVLGWGVGGLEAQTVMFGMPTMLRIPDVIGVELTGALPPGALATDLALTVTQRLRQIGVSGEFVEFFGPGVATLSAGSRAVVANMAPEYGATTGYFPPDERTLDYLRQTGRSADALDLARACLRRNGLWFDPQARPRYTRTITIALDGIASHAAGPRRPQDLLPLAGVPAALAASGPRAPGPADGLPAYPVAIAAITSCTNTSDPALLIAAGLLARKARARTGRRALGQDLAGAGLARRRQLPAPRRADGRSVRHRLRHRRLRLHHLHRQFRSAARTRGPGRAGWPGPARGHPVGQPELPRPRASGSELGFLVSPPLVIAYALAGDAERDLTPSRWASTPTARRSCCATSGPGTRKSRPVWTPAWTPPISRATSRRRRPTDWHALAAPSGTRFPWRPDSTILRRPPFAALDAGSLLGHYTAHPLLVLGDDVTTDHISPASAIPPDSLVADFLAARGEDRRDLNVFASRRGNWEVMLRAAFHSRSLVNLYAPVAPVAHTLHAPRARRCRYGRPPRATATPGCRWCSSRASATAPDRRATGPPRASACWASAPCWR